jgi:hypothetical protein
MTALMAPMFVRHSTASGQEMVPIPVGMVSVPVRRIGALAMVSQRLASSARRGVGDGAQDCVGQGPGGYASVADADGFGDAESLSGSPAGLAGAVEAVGVAVAGAGEGESVGGFAGHGAGEAGGGVVGDGAVEGDVAAAPLGGGGKGAMCW